MMKQGGRCLASVLLAICLLAGATGCGQPVNSTNEQVTATEADSMTENESIEEIFVDNPDRTDEGYVLVWSDEFDGTALDTTKWSCQIGTGTSEGLTDWGNRYYGSKRENT